jgi:hypothetical protein
MNKEKQRIAIAEACGWTKCRLAIKGAGGPERKKSPYGVPPRRGYNVSLPNYTQDLNSMQEVEKAMNNNDWWRFVEYLTNICGGGIALGISATAAQRAEAFLRTIGKWEE